VYSEYEWLPWKFESQIPRHYWDDLKNQRKFLEWAAIELKIKDYKDWYTVHPNVIQKVFFVLIIAQTIAKLGGSSLLEKCSLPVLLIKVFSEYEFQPFKFINCTFGEQSLSGKFCFCFFLKKKMRMPRMNFCCIWRNR
jgi:hypothetical protein